MTHFSKRDLRQNCILREGTCSHEMIQGFTLTGETGCTIRHDTFPLCTTYFTTQVSLWTTTKLALSSKANKDTLQTKKD